MTLAVMVFVVVQLRAEIIYVKAGNNGNGKSWKSAIGKLQDALAIAEAGDEIWVATGTYFPTDGYDRDASFVIPNGVAVYGGFLGHESKREQRQWKKYPTILSGNIGNPNLKNDNSFTVVLLKNVNETTLIDGVIITQGFANGLSKLGTKKRCGGGIFIDATQELTNPIIRNCLFENNFARDGAAIFNHSINATSAPTITYCQFINNRADLDGGAIYNLSDDKGYCQPLISRCYFKGNEATYGAGIMNKAPSATGRVKPRIRDSHFYQNTSYIRGSSIYSTREKGVLDPEMTNCTLVDNVDTVGRSNSKRPEITNDKSSELYFREIISY